MAIKIGKKKASKATLGYGKKSVKVETKYGRMMAKALRAAENARSRFKDLIKK